MSLTISNVNVGHEQRMGDLDLTFVKHECGKDKPMRCPGSNRIRIRGSCEGAMEWGIVVSLLDVFLRQPTHLPIFLTSLSLSWIYYRQFILVSHSHFHLMYHYISPLYTGCPIYFIYFSIVSKQELKHYTKIYEFIVNKLYIYIIRRV